MRQPMSREERHRHILDTAKRLFQERGYENVTIADVIAASNIARGTFYLHFHSLEHLLSDLFEETVNTAWERIAPILADNALSFEARTMAVIDAVLRLFGDDPSLGAVFYCGGGRAFVETKQRAMYDRFGSRLVEALERRHPGVSIPHLDWTVKMLIALVGDMAFYATTEVAPEERNAFEQRLYEFVLAGIRSHLAPHIPLDGI
ncbi:MAG: TetR/AcrR family transcriptional regulator [Alicyclobacillus herbarius]|uniref:TetR/AcrR family transcriptional regulator n=1 Tax=Alicyclobacillus herbarius TaxID=122960 RepID=UPI00041DB911|nr:TetR/AcrR family transcriptional regulator [Alicyclobacillus herbarius]MCL6632672.1 TetR/AcrR family transcriptional regulator [Alicyclobacillus herbarius]